MYSPRNVPVYPSIENLYKVPELAYHKRLVYREKIHGQNFRVGIFPTAPPAESSVDIVYCSRTNIIDPTDKSFSGAVVAVKQYEPQLSSFALEIGIPIVAVFEHYGYKVQKGITYVPDRSQRVILVDILFVNPSGHVTFMDPLDLEEFSQQRCIAVAPIIAEKCSFDSLSEVEMMFEKQWSRVAYLNGVEGDQPIEGVVITPSPLWYKANGALVRAKWKTSRFTERQHAPREKSTVPGQIRELISGMVTEARLVNILSHHEFEPAKEMSDMKYLVPLMVKDIVSEAGEELANLFDPGEDTQRIVQGMVSGALAKLYRGHLIDDADEHPGRPAF